MAATFDLLPQLLEMKQRLTAELFGYQKQERLHKIRWAILDGIILFIGFVTPLIVVYRKSGLYPTEFWVWWCTLTPPLAAGCAILMRVTGVQEKSLGNKKKARKMSYLLQQAEVDLSTCKDNSTASELLRNWHSEAGKIDADY